MEDAQASAVDGRGMLARRNALAARLDADELHVLVVEEAREETHRVRTAADAGNRLVRKTSELFEALATRLVADHALEVTDHVRIRIGPRHRADHVERVVAVGDPVAERFVHRVLERRRTFLDRHDARAEHLHALHVRSLTLHVDCTHVDIARHAQERGDRRRRDAMHTRTRLRDETLLAHALGE